MNNAEYDPHVYPLAAILRRVSILDDAVSARLKELSEQTAPLPVELVEVPPMASIRKPRTIRRPANKPERDLKVKRDDGAFTRAWVAAQARQGVRQHA